jgi:hypothetical protein
MIKKKKQKLAKSKTWKGGWGKNERPGGLKNPKGRSRQKLGTHKKNIPGGLKTRKGGPGKS